MPIIFIVAALVLTFAGLVYLINATKKGNDVVKGEVDKWNGVLIIVLGAIAILLGALFYKQIIAAADPLPGGTQPYLLNWLDNLLQDITSGDGLPMLR